MPPDEHRMLELEEHIHHPLKEFLARMFEHGFAAAAATETKNLDMASGLTRNGVKQELMQIDELLSTTINESIGLLPAFEQRLLIGQQLDVAEDVYLMAHQLAFQRLHRKGRCPIVRLEGDWIPLLTFGFGSDVWPSRASGTARRCGPSSPTRSPPRYRTSWSDPWRNSWGQGCWARLCSPRGPRLRTSRCKTPKRAGR
jgi:hypothetical protein